MGCTQSIRYLYNNRLKLKMAAGKNNTDLNKTDKEKSGKKSIKEELKSHGQNEKYVCDICGQSGLSDADIKSHVLLEHVENQISCPFCDLEGTTFEDMTLHVNSEHLDLLTPTEDKFELSAFGQLTSEQAHNQNSDDPMDTKQTEPKLEDESKTLSNRCDMTPKRARLYLEVPTMCVLASDTKHQDKEQHQDTKQHQDTVQYQDTIPHQDRKQQQDTKQTDSESGSQTPNYSCPLCGWTTSGADEITQHVNIAHLDAMTPTKMTSPDSTDNINNNITSPTFECPLCGWASSDSIKLEQHISVAHSDHLDTPDSLSCPVCGMEFTDTIGLHRHVDGHFSGTQTPGSDQELYDCVLAQELQQVENMEAKQQEQKELEQLQDQYGLPVNSNYKKQMEKDLEEAVAKGQMSVTDFFVMKQEAFASTTGIDDGHSCTKGIIEALHKYYKTGPVGISKYWLCSEVDHYASSFGDKGWGCGYRNLQMLLSSLARCDVYEQVLFNGRPLIPSISKIQRLIEAAWQKGFDRAGCEQLGGKVYNTTKWIGATEIVATLSSLKIKCQLVDFHTPTGLNGTHPKLFEWVKSYFKNADKFKPPLYLQHQGHSRTIIGVEQTKDGTLRLLLFDPSCRKPQMLQFLQDINTNLMRTLRRPLHTLKAKQYQIVSIQGILTDNEYQESKMLKSEQIP